MKDESACDAPPDWCIRMGSTFKLIASDAGAHSLDFQDSSTGDALYFRHGHFASLRGRCQSEIAIDPLLDPGPLTGLCLEFGFSGLRDRTVRQATTVAHFLYILRNGSYSVVGGQCHEFCRLQTLVRK